MDPCRVDELQALQAGTVRPPEGKSSQVRRYKSVAPEGPDGDEAILSYTDARRGLLLRAKGPLQLSIAPYCKSQNAACILLIS